MSNLTVFLKGKKVYLRPLDKKTDLESVQRWINNPEVRLYLNNVYPLTVMQEEQWFDNLGKKDNDIIVAVVAVVDNRLIGVMGLHNIDWISRTAVTGAFIGEKEFRNKGYGTEAKMLLLDYAFNTLNLRKVCSEVIAFNKRSIAYSQKCGYQVECIRPRQYFRQGRYWDQIFLAVYKKDWLKVWQKFS